MNRSDVIDRLAVDARGLSVRFPGRRNIAPRTALDGVGLAIDAGSSVALLGPNGSGKSTLLRVICGMLVPDAGECCVFGERDPMRFRRRLGVVFQSDGLDPHMTVAENLRDQAALYALRGAEARDRVIRAMEQAGLIDRRDDPVKTLSRGLARRVDLCRALLHEPEMLLLDEPTVGLDPTARARFLAMVDDRRAETGLTVLMSTHLVDEADRQDRVILMHEGRLRADGAPGELRNALGRRVVTVADTTWSPEQEGGAWRRAGGMWIRPLDDDLEQATALAHDLVAAGVPFSVAPPTLADVFAHHTGATLDAAEALPAQEAAR